MLSQWHHSLHDNPSRVTLFNALSFHYTTCFPVCHECTSKYGQPLRSRHFISSSNGPELGHVAISQTTLHGAPSRRRINRSLNSWANSAVAVPVWFQIAHTIKRSTKTSIWRLPACIDWKSLAKLIEKAPKRLHWEKDIAVIYGFRFCILWHVSDVLTHLVTTRCTWVSKSDPGWVLHCSGSQWQSNREEIEWHRLLLTVKTQKQVGFGSSIQSFLPQDVLYRPQWDRCSILPWFYGYW